MGKPGGDEDDYFHCRLISSAPRWAGIGEEQAEELLHRAAGIAERAVLRLIAAALTAGQFDALVSFAFNVGAGGLQRSMLHRKVNREEHALVPAELLKWVWAGGRKLKGLVRRREAEAVL